MCVKPIFLRERQCKVPCGFCLECRSRYARGWAIRCLNEAALHDANCFGTLTYDDGHLPEYGSLRKRDAQLFLKRVRKGIKPKVKFYLAGEYGDENKRPHYHFLLFGYSFGDRIEVPSKSPFPLFRSIELERFWDKGLSSVGEVTFASASYIARYVMKKVDKVGRARKYNCDPDTGELREIEPEYSTMSRGGRNGRGLGYGWYEKYHEEVTRDDSVVVDGSELMPPRYYDELLRQRDEAKWELMKLRRERKSKRDGKDMFEERRDALAREVIARSRLEMLDRRL